MIVWGPWKPDLGVFSGNSTTVATNVLRTANGLSPINQLASVSESLGAQAYGAWVYRNSTGNFGMLAATQAAIFKLAADGSWDDVSKVGGYTGPDAGDLWQADLFGSWLILVNANDPPQKFDIDTAVIAADLGGTPPYAKYIETVGDFVFLSAHRSSDGLTNYPRRWQHCAIDDAENWVIDGLEGSSDMQDVPDGDEIMGVFACPGGARLIQRKCKRRLTFSPGTPVAFTQTDIDPTRGAIAANAIVQIGGDNYIYLNETGFYMGDGHVPIGAQQVDRTFLANINLDTLSQVQGVNDPVLKIVWFRYQDGSGAYRLIGYNWQLEQWIDCDAQIQLLVTAVTVGLTVDDILDVVEDYEGVPVDSDVFKGGRITPGGFKEDDILYLFAGSPMEATVESGTSALTPGRKSFVTNTMALGDMPDYSVAVAKSVHPNGPLQWSGSSTRSSRTGKCPHRVDGNFHRFRLTIPEGTLWSICHGLEPEFNPSGGA